MKQLINSSEVFKELKHNFNDFQEEVYVIGVDTKNNFKFKSLLFKGGVNTSIIDLNILFREVLINKCSGFFLAHNHPSKNLGPSKEDEQITQQIKNASEILKLRFLDHLIFSDEYYYSFFESDNF